MNFELTAEQTSMRDMARRLVERELEPILARHDARRMMPKSAFLAILRILAPLGLTAPRLPVEAGGPGIGMLDYGLVFEQLPLAVGMNLLAHEGCISRLNSEGSRELKERLLPDLLAGRRIACTGSTEPDAGSDPRGIRTRLVRDGGKLRLHGRKMWVTNASICDVMLVTCLDQRAPGPRPRVTKVVVERERSPFESREIEMVGLRHGYLGEALFDGCVVFEENVVDAPGGGTEILKRSWNVNRPLVGLQAVHVAQRALDAAIAHAKLRVTFGKPIAAHQLVQKNLADMATSVAASRLLCYQALALVDQGASAEGASAMAKRFAQNACEQVVSQAMNILGALGLAREAQLEQLYRDARMLTIPDGTNELLALIQGRELSGVAAFRDLPAGRNAGAAAD